MPFPLAVNWWTLAVRGALALLLGVMTLAMPGMTLDALVPFFGAYALVEGAINLVGALRARRDGERWRALFGEGAVSVGSGLVAFLLPDLSLLGLVYLLAAWAIATGALELAAAVRLRERLENEWLLAAAGVASVGFGLLLVAVPRAMTIGYWLGPYGIVFGTLLFLLGLRLRSFTVARERTSLREPIGL
jgi:uncharacterized membrane protein HdeD (DUF308 family)